MYPPKSAITIMKLLNLRYKTYFVGGCVRDYIRRKAPHDWDITTSATPNQVKGCLSGYKILDTGIKHGTVSVITDDNTYEITTFRSDGQYTDGRHPDAVHFIPSITEDLSRRDFTMNAIAMSADGTILDPFGGEGDIKNDIIRCVGNPVQRFQEDPLRILRALRFASKLNFSIDPETASAMFKTAHLLSKVSVERIQSEFNQILLGQSARKILLTYREIIAEFIPEIRPCFDFKQNNPFHCYDVLEHIAASVEYAPYDKIIRLTMFFHDVGKPLCYKEDENHIGHFYGHAAVSADIAHKRLRKMRYENIVIKNVTHLVQAHDTHFSPTATFVRKMLNRYGEEQFRRMLQVREADILAQASLDQQTRITKVYNTQTVLNDVLNTRQEFKIKDLSINGNDLIAAGIPQGPKIGEILRILLEEVMNGTLSNTKEALLARIHTEVNHV